MERARSSDSRSCSTLQVDVQLGVGVGTVSVATSPRTEHHRTAVDRTSVHLLEVHGAVAYWSLVVSLWSVHGAVVDLERSFVTERLAACGTQDSLLASGR